MASGTFTDPVPRVADPAHKRERILHALRVWPGLSKVELARRLRISSATASAIVLELVEAGLVVIDGLGPSTGGRPPERLVLNPRRPLMLGIDLSETDIRLGVLNLEGRLLAVERREFRRAGGRVQLEPILEAARGLRARHPQAVGLGLAVPGMLDRERGFVRYAANLGWRDLDVAATAERALGLPVTMDHNSNAALLAEEWWGSAPPTADPFLFVTLGSGIGTAIKVNGTFVRGATGLAGELGHIPADPDGPLCGCGKRGCLEAVASSQALLAHYEQLLSASGRDAQRGRRRPSVKAIAAAAEAGDLLARQALADVAERLGAGLVAVINVLNPALLVLGGELMDAEELVLPAVQGVIAQRALELSAQAVTVRASKFRDQASLIGAGALGFDALFRRVAAHGR